jgi:hypothetical protein
MPALHHGRPAALLLALLLALSGLALAAPASAIPPECPIDDPDCFDLPDIYSWESTLAVTRTQGRITSDPVGIDCPDDCSQTDTQTTVDDPDRPTTGWQTYTLFASGGRTGFAPRWTGCDSTPGSTCEVTNDETSKAVSLSWVDAQTPTLAVSSPTEGQKVGATMTVNATASDNDRVTKVEFFVDNALVSSDPFAPYSATLSMSGRTEGSHAVTVRATDPAGRFVQITRNVTVDRSTSVTLDELPELTNGSSPVILHITRQPDATTTCSFDGGAPIPCDDAHEWTFDQQAADGEHTVIVHATDDVGNTADSALRSTVLDRTAPALAFTSAPTEGSSVEAPSTTITFSHADAHPGAVACTFDSRPTPCTAGQPTTLALASGFHTFTVNTTDLAGNRSTATRSFTSTLPAGTGTGAGGAGGTGTVGPTQLTISKTSTHLHAKATHRSVRKGRRATLVAKGLPKDATGKVVFRKGKKKLCSAKVKHGKASCRTHKLHKLGRYRVKAHYQGSTAYRPSTDRFSFRVRRAG